MLSIDKHQSLPTTMESWLIPQWPAPVNVRAVCTTRDGGVSVPPYDAFNLGAHVGDALASVQCNRALLAEALEARPVFLNQVHGIRMLALHADTRDGQDADGAFARESGLACTVMVADCLPILLCDTQGTVVAGVHAGWRGLAGIGTEGVVEAICREICAFPLDGKGIVATDLMAWLGPCIGPTAFEVGAEVHAAFVEASPLARSFFQPVADGKWLADLAALARQRLQAVGVRQVFGNDSSAPWCTVNNSLRFFSHRRDRVSGRFAACIWLT